MTRTGELPQGFTSRHPTLGDARAVHRLMVACDIAEHGEPDTDLEDVLHEWRNLDLDQDAWLVEGSRGELLGYAEVSARGPDFALDFRRNTLAKLTEFLAILPSDVALPHPS